MQKKLYLLDGHALVYRAHFAFIARPLINSQGMNTSAVTGFVRTLWDLMKTQKPSHIAVSFDTHAPTFRHVMYEPYKANREEQPDDIKVAFPYIKRILEAFKIPILTMDGYEADDIIGTIAKQAEKEDFTVYMVTPDKDYGQLVSPNIYMYKPSRQGNGIDILGEKEILEKWGINRVDQVIDMLGLQGDSVDNIPGIPGIGPKTAAKLLAQYDTVEGLLEHADELKGKQKERVIENRELAILSKELATINVEVPVQFDAKAFEIEIETFDRETLAEIFKELEFRKLATDILGYTAAAEAKPGVQQDLFGQPVESKPAAFQPKAPAKHSVAEKNIENTPHEYILIDAPEKRAELIQLLQKQKTFCFDTETTGIDAHQAELVGMSFSIEPGKGYYVPVSADKEEAKALLQEFRPLFEDDQIIKIGQNIKYDLILMKWYGIEVRGKLFDTMIAHYLLEPGLRHNMDYMAETYLKYQPVSITTLIGKGGKNQLTMRDVPVEKAADYAAEDADITLQLKEYFEPKIKEAGLENLYYEIEAPLINTLVDLEYNGINLNSEFLNNYSKELEIKIRKAEEKIYETAGVKFNIASPKQVGEILFDRMKVPYRWRKTKSGQYSTNEEKLQELAAQAPIVEDILRHRTLSKLKSTYVDALPKMVNPRTGRIHSSFNQALAATGRLSSNNPNLQNIPVRTPEGALVREAFIPRSEEYTLLAADYSQVELRLIAHLSNDEAMLEAFQAGQDIHRATAARVFDVPYEDVTREHRYKAKTVNFSIVYGAGATNLSRQLGIKRNEASEIISNYYAQYRGLKEYMSETVDFARQNGYVNTLLGRRRHIRGINSKSSLERSNSERIAVNTPVQGSAADMIKVAMNNIYLAFKDKGFRSKMILQVHDELVFDAHLDELETIKPIIEEKMKNAIPGLKVPIVVDMGEGKNWREAH